MARPVELAFLRACRRLIPEGSGVLAAVSGGGDSVALVHLLRQFAGRRGWRVAVAHLDHGLRRGSRADRLFVERLARGLGLRCVADRREVGALARPGESPEESARRVRRDFLLEAASQTGCERIATGHTLDDQAETILMRLARGAGPTALTGMSALGPGPFVRPLLELERLELRDHLERKGLDFRDDPTNRDQRFDRNRVRRLVLPALAAALNPRAARHLVQAAGRFREDSRHLDAVAEAALEGLSRLDRRGRLALEASRLVELAPTVGKRVARRALERAGADPRRIIACHVESLIDLARGGNGRRASLPNGMTAERRAGLLLLGRS